MTDEQLSQLRSIIVARIEAIDTSLEEYDPESKPVAPDVAIGRLSRLESMQSQQMNLAQQRRQREERERLKNALDPLNKGSYWAWPITCRPFLVIGSKPCRTPSFA